jgi:hypothetical protein
VMFFVVGALRRVPQIEIAVLLGTQSRTGSRCREAKGPSRVALDLRVTREDRICSATAAGAGPV